jgi:cell division septation protein DedD
MYNQFQAAPAPVIVVPAPVVTPAPASDTVPPQVHVTQAPPPVEIPAPATIPSPVHIPQTLPPVATPTPAISSNSPIRVEVIPAMPDPNSPNTYRLQIGAFSTLEAITRNEQLLRDAGFIAGREANGTTYRVFAMNIPAAEVNSAVRKLAIIGYRQLWVTAE